MKLKYRMAIQHVGSKWFAVALGEDAKKCNVMIHLNETGSRIMELLQEERTEEELEQAILADYEGDEQLIRGSVRAFVEQLSKEGLL